MPPRSPSLRLVTIALLGLASAGACGASMPPPAAEKDQKAADTLGPAPSAEADELARDGKKTKPEEKKEEKKEGSEKPQCPNGALEDPHRGFIRCLKPEERDAKWLPPPPQPEPSAAPSAAPSAEAPPPPKEPEKEAPKEVEKPGPPPIVTVSAPKFEGGEVPRAEKFVSGVLEGVGKCIADNGGMKANKGTLKVTFLVRARGRAEGVEVASQKGISEEAAGCVRLLLKNRAVGAPSSDPVGVTVSFSLEKSK